MLAHLVPHGANSAVVLEDVESCRPSISGPILLQEGPSVLALLAMVVTNERIGHYGNCDDGE